MQTIPGIQKAAVRQALAPALNNLDARRDGWNSEVLSQRIVERLRDLDNQLIKSDILDISALTTLLADDFSSTDLRPLSLREVYKDQAFSVLRADDSVEKIKKREPFSGVDGFHEALTSLTQPFSSAKQKHVHWKVVHVELEETSARVNLLYQADGKINKGVVQQSAAWETEWLISQSLQSPRLKTITVTDFEEISPRGKGSAIFSDLTAAVFANTSAYKKQIVYGVDHWRRELEAGFDLGLSGYHGLSIADVDGDGLDDIFLCQQGGLPNKLFLQSVDGKVQDVSAKSGVDHLDLTHAALLIDADNDGDQDLVGVMGSSLVFFENDGSARFTEKRAFTAQADLKSLCAADFDGDGDLDIFVCGYSPDGKVWKSEGRLSSPVPYHDANNGGPNQLYRNEGRWQFVNATSEVGLDVNNRRFSFAASWEDYDNDGDMDLYVANDFGRNNLYRNDKGQFTDVAAKAGVEDISTGMSVSWGDYNQDGWMDLYVGNMFSSAGNRIAYQRRFLSGEDETTRSTVQRVARGNSLFQNQGDGTFLDVSENARVTMGRWAWSSLFFDMNNNGREDLLVANGFITHENKDDL